MPITHSKVSAVADGGDATLIRPSDWNASHVGMEFVKLAETVLGSAAATIDFTSIPATYGHLRLVLQARMDGAGTSVSAIGMRFNNDSSAIYDYYHNADTGIYGVTYIKVAAVTQGGNAAGIASMSDIIIQNYRRTTFQKTASIRHGWKISTSSAAAYFADGFWRNTAAIDRITLLNVADGANFDVGTIASLYGLGIA